MKHVNKDFRMESCGIYLRMDLWFLTDRYAHRVHVHVYRLMINILRRVWEALFPFPTTWPKALIWGVSVGYMIFIVRSRRKAWLSNLWILPNFSMFKKKTKLSFSYVIHMFQRNCVLLLLSTAMPSPLPTGSHQRLSGTNQASPGTLL